MRAGGERLEQLRQDRHTTEQRLDAVRTRTRALDLETNEVDLRREALHEHIAPRARRRRPTSWPACPRPRCPRARRCRARRASSSASWPRSGPVNPLALEELSALEERHKELEAQVDDVRGARRELHEVVRTLDQEIMTSFAAAAADVNEHFSTLVAMLFPGGTGRLVLTEPDDLLNTGVEIEVRPAGRNVRRVSLLSGGERSMAALAFLFAVFRSRPSPFYLMDEVEAALDDVNLHRFLGLVREFRDEAQLLIVSHQKRTMETGDALYGVTMAPGGSSQVVSQKVERREPEPSRMTALLHRLVAVAVVLAAGGRRGPHRPLPAGSGPTSPPTTTAAGRGRRRQPNRAPEPAPTPTVEPGAPTPELEPTLEPERRARARGRARPTAAAWAACAACSAGPSPPLRSGRIDAATWDSLEEALIRADVGVATTDALLDDLRGRVEAKEIAGGDRPAGRLSAPTHPRAARRRPSRAPLRFDGTAGAARRLAGRRGQRRGQDHHHRQAGPAADGRRAARCCWPPATPSGPPPPTSSACGPSGPAPTSSAAPRAATRAPSSSTPCSGPPPGATTWSWPTRPAACTTRSTWSRSSRRSAGWPTATRAT